MTLFIGLLEPPKNRFIMSETSPTVNGRRSTSVPATARLSEGQGAAYLRPVASGGRLSLNQRRHNFSQKTIIKSENCLPCGNRSVTVYLSKAKTHLMLNGSLKTELSLESWLSNAPIVALLVMWTARLVCLKFVSQRHKLPSVED